MNEEVRSGLLGGTVVSMSSSDDVRNYYDTIGADWGDHYKAEAGSFTNPATLRLRLVLEIIKRFGCDDFFDVGCASAPVMLELLRRGKSVRGVDFSEVLVRQGKTFLEQNGFDPDLCQVGDAIRLDEQENSHSTVLCLGVLPHIERMDLAVRELVRITKPGGILILSFRNDLFDLFTFNRFTLEFFVDNFLQAVPFTTEERERALTGLRTLVTHSDRPDAHHTDGSTPKEFGRLTRINHNPLTIGEVLAEFGVTHLLNGYYKFHPLPPILQDQFPNFKEIGAKMDETFSFSWIGMFMCSTFVAVFRKNGG